MKPIVSVVLAAAFAVLGLFSFTSTASAQARPFPADNAITMDFFQLVNLKIGSKLKGQNLNVQYEYKLDQASSIAGRAVLYPDHYSGASVFGFGGTYRFYIADSRALTGMSVGPGADLFIASGDNDSYTIFGLGGDFQYKWIFSGFVVEPSFMLRQLFAPDEISTPGGDASGLYWRLRANVGYAW
jgi:hypothetical protein